MPKTMTSAITAQKNQLTQPGAWVWLLTIALPNSGPTLRYASNTEDVTYGGNVYTGLNFTVDSFAFNADGEIPEFSMAVTNIGYDVQQYMRDYEGLIGGTVTFVYVNTGLLAQDWSEDATTLVIVGARSTWGTVEFTLGVPSGLRRRVPEDRLNPHSCRHKFRTSRCGYGGSTISTIAFPSGTPVQINMAAAHGFVTGDQILLETTGITGLDGVYTITYVDSDSFTLDGTDGDDYTGPYVSGGDAGYAYCDRIPEDCSTRGRFPGNYGGPLSLRREALRYA